MKKILKDNAIWLLLFLGISLITLFASKPVFGGFIKWIVDAEFYSAMVRECLILFGILLVSAVLCRYTFSYYILVFAIVLGFSYLHQILIPVIAVTFYGGSILLMGRVICRGSRSCALKDNIGAWIYLGCSAEIIMISVLSLLNMAEIDTIRYSWIFFTLIAAVVELRHKDFKKIFNTCICDNLHRKRPEGLCFKILFSACIVFFLIQLGRANISCDFDSLWYGLRPEYVLSNSSKGIYEDLGLLSSVFVYTKGFEVLTIPLAGLASYGYLLIFNLFWAVLVAYIVFKMTDFVNTKKDFRMLCVLLVVAIPGIMNMSVSVKPDMVTLLFQLLMIYFYLLNKKEADKGYLTLMLGSYIFSLTLKPTSLIFSSALLGILFFDYFILRKRGKTKEDKQHLKISFCLNRLYLLFWGIGSMFFIMLRSYLIVGLPLTNIASGLMIKLGFKVKYPYSMGNQDLSSYASKIYSWSNIKDILKRLFNIFFLPNTPETDHVSIAWGTILVIALVVANLIIISWKILRKKINKDEILWLLLFSGILTLSLLTMVILPKPDGNYYMLLYTILPIVFIKFCNFKKDYRVKIGIICAPLIFFAFFYTCAVNWAWSAGFTEIKLRNCGYYDHKNEFTKLLRENSEEIYERLSEKGVRAVTIGSVTLNASVPAISEMLNYAVSAGNTEILGDTDSFEKYLSTTKKDYILADTISLKSDGYLVYLIRSLIEDAFIEDLIINEEYSLFVINGDIDKPVNGNAVQEKLGIFDTCYLST